MNPIELGVIAAQMYKESVKKQRARSGRNIKGTEKQQSQLQAAGSPKMNTGSVFAYPRGRAV